MNVVEKINLILKQANISKVNLAKYLGVSRQMVYNYLDGEDLSKLPNEKCQLLLKLLGVKTEKDIDEIVIDDRYIQSVGSKIFDAKKPVAKKNEIIELSGLKKDEQLLISDIVFLLKEMFNEDKTRTCYDAVLYLYHFLQSMSSTKELKYILGYFSKSAGYTKPNEYVFEEEKQFIFESIMYSAMTLYANTNTNNNAGASRTKLAESHKRWEAALAKKNEEKMSRTQELNTAKVQALRELGYTEINERNASEVFDKIAEIQARNITLK